MVRILANENIPVRSVHILQNAGFDIKSISLENAGISDEEVMQIAINEDRTSITFDSDYGELIFKHGYKPNGGVVYLRWDTFTPEYAGMFLSQFFDKEDIDVERRLTVIDKNGIRQRKY